MSPSSTSSDWLTVKQVCTIAQCGTKLLYREIKAGRLRAAIIGGRRDLRIHRSWIDEWLTRCATPIEITPRRGAA